jgi:hypothetical protein
VYRKYHPGKTEKKALRSLWNNLRKKRTGRKSQEAETACGFSVLMKLSGRLPEYTKIISPAQKYPIRTNLIATIYSNTKKYTSHQVLYLWHALTTQTWPKGPGLKFE